MRAACLLVAVALAAVGAPTLAQHNHGETPHVDVDVTLKLGTDRNYRSSNNRSVLTDVYGEAEAVARFHFNSTFFVQAKLHWERVKFATESRVFGGHGAYIENLSLNAAFDEARLYAGKFNPAFGMGWDDAKLPGFYANEFAKDYQTKEAIGAGAGYGADLAAFGKHKVDIATFFFDNSFLSR